MNDESLLDFIESEQETEWSGSPQELEEARKLKEVVSLFQSAPDALPPPTLRSSILEALENEIAPELPWWHHIFRILRSGPALAAACVLLVTGIAGYQGWGLTPQAPPQVLAGLTSEGLVLIPGIKLQLAPGETQTINWRGLGEVVLDGPAEFVLEDWAVQLAYGTLSSNVDPPDSAGFAVETPNARVDVIGTRFSVTYNPEQGSAVQVFEGEVRVEDLRTHLVRTLTPQQRSEWQLFEVEAEAVSTPPRPPTPPLAVPPPKPKETPSTEPKRLPGDQSAESPSESATIEEEGSSSEEEIPEDSAPETPAGEAEEEYLDPADLPANTIDEGF